jgi:DNA-directed RNA polymerase specialized sigma24 family protein
VRPPDREDLVHDILLELHEGLARRYEAGRGRFRAFLCGVVRMKVLSHWKRARREAPLDEELEPAAPSEEPGEAVEVVAEVLGAVRRWHDRTSARPEGLPRVYVLAGRLVRGESYREIARREGISVDAVKRHLAAAREEIVADLLAHALPIAPEVRVGLEWPALAARLAEALANSRRRGRVLDEIAQPAVREGLEALLVTLERLRRDLGRTPDGAELHRGLEEVFGGC